jgi:tetratricopeptide (TPR) repeat protein
MICVAAAALSYVPRRGAIAAGALVGAALALAAYDRLATFSHPLLLWEDAVQKLPDKPVPWGSRTLYGAGREYLYAGQPAQAIEVTERCVRLYPQTAQCHYARGAVHLHLGHYEHARRDLARTIELQPGQGIVYHRLGLALEGLGRLDEAKAAYRRAVELRYAGGQFELQRLETPGRGLLAPGTRPGARQ